MPNSGRSRLRGRAVVNLLREKTIAEAAEKTGIGLRTLQRWLTEPDFQEFYQKAEDDLFARDMARTVAAYGNALDALVEIANDKTVSPAVRVSALGKITDLSNRAYENISMNRRIAALERTSNVI